MKLTEVLSMLGGIGLFLYGMTLMSTGLKNAAGDRLRQILERVTSNRLAALLVGLVVTLLIQSSSATDMMLIGFVDSGLMPLAQAFGVILGANIGTTVTAQITAFDLTALAPFLLFVGCVIVLFVKKPFIQSISTVVLGFGMLFVGIGMMKGEGLVDVESGLAVVAETEGGVADEMALQIAGQAVELADAHAGGQQSHKLVGPFVLQGVHRTADGCDGLALGKDVGPGNVVFLVE